MVYRKSEKCSSNRNWLDCLEIILVFLILFKVLEEAIKEILGYGLMEMIWKIIVLFLHKTILILLDIWRSLI